MKVFFIFLSIFINVYHFIEHPIMICITDNTKRQYTTKSRSIKNGDELTSPCINADYSASVSSTSSSSSRTLLERLILFLSASISVMRHSTSSPTARISATLFTL